MNDSNTKGRVNISRALESRKAEDTKQKHRTKESRYSGSSKKINWTSAGRTTMTLFRNIFNLRLMWYSKLICLRKLWVAFAISLYPQIFST
jgi:hypothetical protein